MPPESTERRPPSGTAPLRQPVDVHLAASPFVRLARFHVLSVSGDTFVTVALAGSLFFDISPSAARGRVALSLVLSMAPFAVVAPFLGPFIDRSRGGRRRAALLASAGRAVLAMLAAEAVHSLTLFPLVFGLLVLSKAHGVAKSSLVKATVPSDAAKSELVRANSRLAVLAAVSGFVAAVPAVAILRVPFAGSEWVLRTAAVVFGAAAVASVTLVDRGTGAGTGAGPGGEAEPAGEHAGGLLAPGIFQAATSMAVLRGLVGFLAFQIAFAFRRQGAPAWWLGVALAASAAGSLTGSLLAPRLRRWVSEEILVLGCLVAVALAGLGAFVREGRGTMAVCASVVGLAASIARLAFDSLVQRRNPEQAQGRAFARFEAAFQLVWVAGALIPIGLSLSLAWGGLFVMVVAAVGAAVYASELLAVHRARGEVAS